MIKSLGCALFLTTFLASAAVSHQVKTTDNVGGMLHIEPDDNPRAGQPALTWFTLTRKGGKIIPLSECNCKLTVYAQRSTTGAVALDIPPLKGVSVQQYQGVPGVEITFPTAGAYQLNLKGTPAKNPADFQPFELKFDVTVAPGTTAPVAPKNPQPIQNSNQLVQPTVNKWQIPTIAIGSIVIIAVSWTIWQRLQAKSDKN